ncbi:PKD domain-containing protein (plasmid) [Haloferax mediterranei ATCC 33500]|uniref:(Chitin-binding domain type 3)-containing protein n=1 Tax=Haloferax mediterranei (strain ATCC 33500 / DSM 1411 / JCM 8866 / NBRC 14739 / NCIMB 2177 / R-4) TaxID=523841 RepID=I3R9P4_HALMT|nr:PKD domain-containing protein [Haloferax mediterranei]AFK20954.1 (chitin-binding domain type 3)-containing protein [Haloferax mediterranei ATCC 33500]AHZ24178.1 chitinase [Haloferax mediterranei ATCC 33500]MDX5989940.1 PKD domain-containing protein [Haloferax mediterranei ATCC 33500]QCQ77129.1 PKD domain-containing protein [Haloferax mediterranei ATCC 33500]
MKQNRREYLRNASVLFTSIAGASVTVSGAESPPQWDSDTTYTGGDRVVHEGYIWEAKWWTHGTEPSTKTGNPWKQIREEGGGSGEELKAVIEMSATTVTVDEDVTLDASKSTGDIDTYEWTVDDRDPITGVETTVSFDTTGDHTVTLTVTNTDEDTATAEKTVTVESDGGGSGDLTPETTIKEFFPKYEDRYIPDIFLDFMPGENDGGHGSHGGHSTTTVKWTDAEKAADFNVDLDAIRNNVSDGSLTFDSLGTQALDWAKQFRSKGLPDHAIAQLLPRLMLLPDKTEDPTFQGPGRAEAWDETAGPVPASNDPSLFYQEQWPTDARNEKEEEVKERDRVYFQAKNDPAWSDDFEYIDNYDSALLDTLQNDTHPATGDPLGGDRFTANAPMEANAEIHGSDWFWHQVLLFKNTSPVPYHLDGAVIWWLGPANFGKTMSAGAYNNEQRPRPGYGHPQRDIIEITLEDKHVPEDYADIDSTLSAYAVRLAYHDSPYNMRTAYPGQYWSIEVSVGEPLTNKFDTPEKRQRVVDMIAETAHVELETDMDLNDDVVDAIELYNRVGN